MVAFTHETRRSQTFILACIYTIVLVTAFLFGFALLYAEREHAVSIFRLLPATRPNGLILLCSVFFPFLITYVAIKWNKPAVIWLLVFIESSIFSWLCFGVRNAFHEAGWMLQLLLLFSGHLSLVIYHCIWMRCLVFKNLRIPVDLFVSAIVLLLIYFLDLFIVCPFTASLFIHK